MKLSPYLKFARSLAMRDRPSYVHFAVTSRCNLRCRSCVIWQRGRTQRELDVAEIDEMAGVLARLGCAQVSLGGGEPAMREDLPEIVRCFLRRDIRVRALTNGVAMTPSVARRLVGTGLREVSFSLDSLDPDVQDDMDAGLGNLERRIDNLMALADILPRRGTIPILNTVVTHHNFRELPRLLDLAERLGFYSSFIPIHLAEDQHKTHRFYGDAPDLALDPAEMEELRAVYAELIARKRRRGHVINSTSFLERSPDYLLHGRATWPCRAGEQFLSVSPDGRISACHAFEESWSFPYREFERVFHEPGFRARLADRVAGCEGCFRPCWAEVAFMLHEPRSLLEMVRIQAQSRLPRPRVDAVALRRTLLGRSRPADGAGPDAPAGGAAP